MEPHSCSDRKKNIAPHLAHSWRSGLDFSQIVRHEAKYDKASLGHSILLAGEHPPHSHQRRRIQLLRLLVREVPQRPTDGYLADLLGHGQVILLFLFQGKSLPDHLLTFCRHLLAQPDCCPLPMSVLRQPVEVLVHLQVEDQESVLFIFLS